MTRTISPALAPIVEELELIQPVVVTTQELHEIITRVTSSEPSVVIQRLAQRGWLLDTGVKGAWEFIPGAHAGRYRHGDPFLVLRAQLAVRPDTPVRVCLRSAMWKLGHTDRSPATHEVSLPPGAHVPAALDRAYGTVRFAPVLKPAEEFDLPVDRAETVLVNLADTPTQVRSWSAVLDALSDLSAAASADALVDEAAPRSHATRVRLAYLLEGTAPKLVDALDVSATSKVWFGPRGELRRHDAKWNIADTVLPRHPADR